MATTAPLRVLYVDDSRFDRELVRDALEKEHGQFQIIEAASREEFESRLTDSRFDIVLSDFNILGFQGLQVIDAVRQRFPGVPVVIVTGTGSEEVAVEALTRGAADYVIKSPHHIQRLPVTIQAAIDRQRLAEDHDRAQLALLEREAQLRLALEAARMGTFDWDLTTGRIVWSRVHEALWGYAPGTFRGSYRECDERLHADDRAGLEAAIVAARDQRHIYRHEYRVVWPDGSSHWVAGQGQFDYDETGRPLRMRGVVADITDRKQAEEERDQLLAREKLARAAAEEAIEQLHDIQAVIDVSLTSLMLDEMLPELLIRVRRLLGADTATILLIDPAGQTLIRRASQGLEEEIAEEVRLPVGQGILGRIASTRGPAVVADLSQAPDTEAYLRTRLTSLAGCPLQVGDRLLGVLYVGTAQAHFFGGRDVHMLQLAAGRAAAGIERARLHEQERTNRQQLQTLSRQLLEAQERERRHIAQELHDELGQSLTMIKLHLQALASALATPPSRLVDSLALVDRTIQQVRTLSLDLRPSMLDDLGLVPALRWFAHRHAEGAGLEVRFHADQPQARFATAIETACFRVAQEALTNVVRHAQAQQVVIELHQDDDQVEMVIQDDGIGFEVAAAQLRATQGGSIGLLGMQERATLVGGQFDLASTPGQGTVVRVRFPLTCNAATRAGV